VTAPGRRDGWAVGLHYHGQAPIRRPYVLHWNGTVWRPVALPTAGPLVTVNVVASSPANVWVFGNLNGVSDAAEAVRWDGARWHVIRIPAAGSSDDPVVLGPSDAWILGGETVCPAAGPCDTVLHWDGSRWHPYVLPTLVGGELAGGISGSGPDNVWAVGSDPASGGIARIVAFRWNGKAWRSVRMPHPRIPIGGTPVIDVAGRRNVWIVAILAHTAPGHSYIHALHWDGRSWHMISPPVSARASFPIIADGGHGLWFGVRAHWTGHRWVSPVQGTPFNADFTEFAQIPGTSTIWAVGLVPRANIAESLIQYNGTLPK